MKTIIAKLGAVRPRGSLARRTFVVAAVALSFTAVPPSFSKESRVDTWRLNEAESSIPSGMVKNTTVSFVRTGNQQVKMTTEGVDRNGRSVPERIWVGRRDSTFYPVKTSKTYDSVAYTRLEKNKTQFKAMKGDKVVMKGIITVEYPHKQRKVTMVWVDSNGRPYKSVAVYDRQ